jgi:hypothetical protein
MADDPPDKPYEREEYIEQNEEEREAAGRNKSVIALAVMAVLVIAGIVLAHRLRDVSALQDCLMTRATNCAEIVNPSAAPR